MRKIPPLLIMDAFRGFAALWVVMCHASMQFIDGGHLEYFKNPLYAFSCYGALGVPIFFVISGYCITGAAYESIRTSGGVTRFVSARIRRIYPPYLVVFALTVLIGVVSVTANKHILRLSHDMRLSSLNFWLTNLTLTHHAFKEPVCVMVSWSLCYELTFYAIVGVFISFANYLHRGYRNKKIRTLSLLTFFLTLLSLTWLILSPKTCPYPLDYWYQFGIGGMLFFCLSSHDKPHVKCRGALFFQFILIEILTLAFGLMYRFSHVKRELQEGFVLAHPNPTTREEALVCVTTAMLLWFLWQKEHSLVNSRLIQMLMWLGTISYSLYLTHMLVLPFLIARMSLIGLDGHYYWITFLCVLTASVIGGWIFNRFVESPFISFMNRQRVDEERKLIKNALL